jgi:HD-GYP domain-containing protein (c-di-GMP phosphodiesterase class II)
MKFSKIIILILVLFSSIANAQLTNKEVKAKIVIEENSDFISITGFAENLTDGYKSLYYKLSVIKGGKGNNKSNNMQSGRFTIEANQIKALSNTQVNLVSDNQTIILLLIYDENQVLIGKDRLVLGEKKVLNTISKPKDGIEITGIVSDNTKTKMGKDFYDIFYNEYGKLKLNSSKMILVEEELTNVRTTKITIKIDSEIVNEFITKPDEEFLLAMAEDTAAKTFNYLKNLEKQDKYITQY